MNKYLPIVPLLFLAACDKSPKVEAENASIEEVAGKVRAANAGSAMIVNPGQWESTVELESVDVPGMPPEFAAQMKKTMARVATGHKTCLTKEQAMKPKEDFFAGANSNCRYDKFSMDDGKMTGTMRCTSPQGGTPGTSIDSSSTEDSHWPGRTIIALPSLASRTLPATSSMLAFSASTFGDLSQAASMSIGSTSINAFIGFPLFGVRDAPEPVRTLCPPRGIATALPRRRGVTI